MASVDGAQTLTLILVRHGQTVANKQRVVQSAKGGGGGGLSMAGAKQCAATARTLAALSVGQAFDLILVSDCKRTVHTAELLLDALPSELRAASPIVFEPLCRERHPGKYEGSTSDAFAAAARNATKAEARAKAKARAQSLKAKGKTPQSRRKVAAEADAAMDEPAAIAECDQAAENTAAARAWRPEGGGESWEDVGNRATAVLRKAIHLVARSRAEREAANPSEEQGSRHPQVLVVTHGGFIKEFINSLAEGWRERPAAAATAGAEAGTARKNFYPNNIRNGSLTTFSVEINAGHAAAVRRAARAFVHAKVECSASADKNEALVATAAAVKRSTRENLTRAVAEAAVAARTVMTRENEAAGPINASAAGGEEAAVQIKVLEEPWEAHKVCCLQRDASYCGAGLSDSDGEDGTGPMSAKALRRSMRNSRRAGKTNRVVETRVEVVRGIALCGNSIGEKLAFRAGLMNNEAAKDLGTHGGGSSDVVVVHGRKGGWHLAKRLRDRDPVALFAAFLLVGAATAVAVLVSL